MSDGIRIRRRHNDRIVVEGVRECGDRDWFDGWFDHKKCVYYHTGQWEEIPPTLKTENVTGECRLGGRFVSHADCSPLVTLLHTAEEKGFSLEQVEAYVIPDKLKRENPALMTLLEHSHDIPQCKQSALLITRTTEEG